MKPPRLASSILITVSVLGASHCGREAASSAGGCPPCHAPFSRDAEREADIRRRWSEIERRIGLVANSVSIRCLCFGDGPSVLVEDGNAYLASSWEFAEQTARAAHLGLHRTQPPWDDPANGSCDERVAKAVEAEVAGHALELEVRRELGINSARYPFEAEYFARPAAERAPFLRAYFASHPEGDGVVPGFVLQYRARCLAPTPK